MLISNSNLNLVRRGANTLHISKKQPPPALGDPSPFLKIPELPPPPTFEANFFIAESNLAYLAQPWHESYHNSTVT